MLRRHHIAVPKADASERGRAAASAQAAVEAPATEKDAPCLGQAPTEGARGAYIGPRRQALAPARRPFDATLPPLPSLLEAATSASAEATSALPSTPTDEPFGDLPALPTDEPWATYATATKPHELRADEPFGGLPALPTDAPWATYASRTATDEPLADEPFGDLPALPTNEPWAAYATATKTDELPALPSGEASLPPLQLELDARAVDGASAPASIEEPAALPVDDCVGHVPTSRSDVAPASGSDVEPVRGSAPDSDASDVGLAVDAGTTYASLTDEAVRLLLDTLALYDAPALERLVAATSSLEEVQVLVALHRRARAAATSRR
jgi:hypothetical protein